MDETVTPGTGEGQVAEPSAAPETGQAPTEGEPATPETQSIGQGEGAVAGSVPDAPGPELRAWATRTSQENAELRRRVEAMEQRVPAPKKELNPDELPAKLRANWERMKPEEREVVGEWGEYVKAQAERAAQAIVYPFVARQEIAQAKKAIPDFDKYEKQILDVAETLRGSRLMPSQVLEYAATIVKGQALKGEATQAALKSLQARKTASSLEAGNAPSTSPAGKKVSMREAFQNAITKHGGKIVT